MRIHLANKSKQQIGGGFTFLRNLKLALKDKVEFVDDWKECDVFFISGVTMLDKSDVQNAYDAGKKIVLRVDNMPRKSRNKCQPHERMRNYADKSKAVIYQSRWAYDWIGSYVGFKDKSHIILNGVDTSIFYKQKERPFRDYLKFLYVRYNRDENKRPTEAFDMFTQAWMQNNKNELIIVGQFSEKQEDAKFDFFRGEKFHYVNVIEDRNQLAGIMRDCDILLYPSYSDACPNTVIEAKACGMEVYHHGHAGIGEACSIEDPTLERMGNEYLDIFNKIILKDEKDN